MAQQYQEGQKLQGSDGNVYVVVNGVPTRADAAPSAPGYIPPSPARVAKDAEEERRKNEDQQFQRDNADRADRNADRADRTATRGVEVAERTAANQGYDNTLKLRSDFDALPTTKEFRVAISQLATGLRTKPDATGDNALIYSYAKAMDPASVVRESEMGMAASGASWVEAAVANYKKQFGIEGGGQLSPDVRERMRREMLNKVGALNQIYSAQRNRYIADATAFGIDPKRVIGNHDSDVFQPIITDYLKSQGLGGDAPVPMPAEQGRAELEKRISRGDAPADTIKWLIASGRPPSPEQVDAIMANAGNRNPDVRISPDETTPPEEGSYGNSFVGQALSGANEGLAGLLGLPADIATGALNLVPRGINALANTDIPLLPNAIGGSQWIKDRFQDVGSIQGQTADPTKQFVRRAAESVGASAVPSGFAARTLRQAGAGLLTGLGGGIGGATAQQVAPGNPLAEILGEVAGGGLTGLGALRGAQRGAQRQIEAAIPTVDDLKKQASNLYRKAETRGVAANPTQTRGLADDMRKTLLDEGQLGPNGKITDADTNTSKAFNLIEQYADQPMRPKEMNTVRTVLSDSRKSPDPSDQRLGKILLDQFDEWVSPLAPDFDEARGVASRYLQAEDLEQAKELAGARAGQFTGSGFENALRTEYRGLDRGSIRGRNWFSPEVSDAIQNVSRGTPGSNTARAIGRFAPMGPVSAATTMGVPAALGTMVVGGPAGVGLGLMAGGLGGVGRAAATKMGIRNADIAELTARNGGAVEQAPLVPSAFKDYAAWLAAVQQAKYLTERPQQPSR